MKDSYFTYISRNKIDNLLSAYETSRPIEWKELKTIDNEIRSSIGIGKLFNFFLGGKKVKGIETLYKADYVNRLQILLAKICKDIRVLRMPMYKEPLKAKFYLYSGVFKLHKYDQDSQIVSLVSEENGYKLILNGSLNNFNDDPCASQFSGSIPSHLYTILNSKKLIKYETVFLIQNYDNKIFEGTPIYMLFL